MWDSFMCGKNVSEEKALLVLATTKKKPLILQDFPKGLFLDSGGWAMVAAYWYWSYGS